MISLLREIRCLAFHFRRPKKLDSQGNRCTKCGIVW